MRNLQKRHALRGGQVRDDLSVVLAATLTLLGLIIGFTFSMATTRYDMRKNYEEAEANAIGTEYLRTELLPEAEATRTKTLLRAYVTRTHPLLPHARAPAAAAKSVPGPRSCRHSCGKPCAGKPPSVRPRSWRWQSRA